MCLSPPCHSPSREDGAGTQGRNLEAGTEVGATEERSLLACSPSSHSASFLILARSTVHGELAAAIISQEKCLLPTTLAYGNAMEAFSQLRFPLPRKEVFVLAHSPMV